MTRETRNFSRRYKTAIVVVGALSVIWAAAISLRHAPNPKEAQPARIAAQTADQKIEPSTGADNARRNSLVLGCKSIELYKRFIQEWDGDEQSPLSQEFKENVGDDLNKNCNHLIDHQTSDNTLANIYHVVGSAPGGFVCVRDVRGIPCYWTEENRLLYIGKGPQLTDEQFAQVVILREKGHRLREMAEVYLKRENRLRDSLVDLDHERAEAARREADELNALASEAIRQSWELVSQAFKVGH